jgi:hypothetical protein
MYFMMMPSFRFLDRWCQYWNLTHMMKLSNVPMIRTMVWLLVL